MQNCFILASAKRNIPKTILYRKNEKLEKFEKAEKPERKELKLERIEHDGVFDIGPHIVPDLRLE